jgi:hypothetical protein
VRPSTSIEADPSSITSTTHVCLECLLIAQSPTPLPRELMQRISIGTWHVLCAIASISAARLAPTIPKTTYA